jgi:hypothetical protein
MCVILRTEANKPADWDDEINGTWAMQLTAEQYIDEYISAELPEMPHPKDKSKAANQQREYCELVKGNMYHTCKDDYCKENGKCKKRFPVIFLFF